MRKRKGSYIAHGCCKDSVAMYLRSHNFIAIEGEVVECRWCSDGYGQYLNGIWSYGDAVGDFIARETSPEAQAKRDELRARLRIVK